MSLQNVLPRLNHYLQANNLKCLTMHADTIFVFDSTFKLVAGIHTANSGYIQTLIILSQII